MNKGKPGTNTFDVTRAWKQTEKALHAMTPQEKKQTFVKAGILTKSGKIAKPYKQDTRAAR